MNKIFTFDVTLKDLMNLGERAREVSKLDLIFRFLNAFWYVQDKKGEEERWNSTRVGSVDVFMDEDKNLHLDFATRFSLKSYPEIVKILERLKDR